jgi:hypothetical protein
MAVPCCFPDLAGWHLGIEKTAVFSGRWNDRFHCDIQWPSLKVRPSHSLYIYTRLYLYIYISYIYIYHICIYNFMIYHISIWIILYVPPRTSVFLPRASPGVSWDFDHRDVQGGALGSCCSSSWAETLPLPLGARGNWRESPSENKVPMEKTENFRILHLYVELIWELIRFWNLVLVRTMIVTICNYGFPKWYD